MREQDIIDVDPSTLDEDDLDEVIGSATRILKRLDHDKKSAANLTSRIVARVVALKKARRQARNERKGR